MGLKTARTTHSINNTFDPGTAKENTVQWWFKKVCKRDESLQDVKHSGQSLEVEYDQLRGSLKLILLQLTTREIAKELSINNSVVVQHLKQIGKVKKLSKWVPHELTTNQKNHSFEVLSSSYSSQ